MGRVRRRRRRRVRKSGVWEMMRWSVGQAKNENKNENYFYSYLRLH